MWRDLYSGECAREFWPPDEGLELLVPWRVNYLPGEWGPTRNGSGMSVCDGRERMQKPKLVGRADD
jgi:hypothetical protein